MVTHSLPIPIAYPTVARRPAGFELSPRPEAEDTFMKAMLELPSEYKRRNPLEWVCAALFQAVVIAALIIAPLYFTEAIDLKAFQNTWLAEPAPPGPPPPPAAPQVQRAMKSVPRLVQGGRMMAPSVIPKNISIIKEAPLPPETEGGVVGGVPGGVPGGTLGGVLGGILSGSASPAASVVPPPPAAKRVIRVGGKVEPPRQVNTVALVYPAIAKVAKVQGTVVVDAIIDEQGDVIQARVVSGPGLLVGAALQAVEKWKFEPTRLNGQPVSVEMEVKVHFTLQ